MSNGACRLSNSAVFEGSATNLVDDFKDGLDGSGFRNVFGFGVLQGVSEQGGSGRGALAHVGPKSAQ